MRLAGIDLGTNTIRLLVADADAARGLRPVHDEQVVARLGEGLAGSGVLAPAAMARAAAAVRAYRDRAQALGAKRIIVVATAAVRDAANGEVFVRRLAAEDGLTVRVAPGEEEARLTLLGVVSGLPLTEARFGLLDIGGGSTELVSAHGANPVAAASLTLGVVRLAERFFHADPVDWAEYGAARAHVAERLAADAWPAIRPTRPDHLVGTGGTLTTLAALDLDLAVYDPHRVHGHRLRVDRVEALRRRLGGLRAAERARIGCLEPGREDLIIPGIAITVGVLQGLDLEGLTVSETGFREGILLDAIGWASAAS